MSFTIKKIAMQQAIPSMVSLLITCGQFAFLCLQGQNSCYTGFMKDEIEIVPHQYLDYMNLFVVQIKYRNPHLHRDFEICLCLSENTTFISHNRIETLHKGDMLIFNPNETHEIKGDGDGSMILIAQLSPKYLRDAFPGMGHLSFNKMSFKETLSPQSMQNLNNLFIELAYQYLIRQDGWQLLCRSLTDSLIFFMMQHLPYRILSEEEWDSMRRRIDRMNRIMSYVEENYSSRLLLSDVAEREGLTLSYLSYFLKDNLNHTFQEYVSSVRFQYAKTLLLSGKPLIDVCMESGFSDSRYLTKAFLKYEGCTPTEYKLKQYKNTQNKNRNIYAREEFLSPEDSLQILKQLRKPLGSFYDNIYHT